MARSSGAGLLAVPIVLALSRFGCYIQSAEGADVVVGGADGWVDGIKYNPLQAQVGDVLVSLSISPPRWSIIGNRRLANVWHFSKSQLG